MKIVLVTYGSRGDVQPMLALALGLKAQGHDALLVGPPERASWAAQLGCPYAPLGDDVTALVDAMESVYSLASAKQFISLVRSGIDDQFRHLPALVTGADLVIGSSLVFALSSVAEAQHITYRYIAFAPHLLPSGDHPYPVVQAQQLPRWLNRLSWWLGLKIDVVRIRRQVNTQRRKLGLAPVLDVWEHVLGSKVVVASDEAISRVPSDVATPTVQTGYMHLDQPDPGSLALAAFLSAGPSPVYAGFGSMPKPVQARSLPIVVQAARKSGRPAVIAKFWDDPTPFDDADDIFFITKYPHQHLFPAMAAIIHHGGAGTTAAAAASGRPQIIVPHILDQYYWGSNIYRSHLGPKPIPRNKLTVTRLTRAIEIACSEEKMRKAALDASQRIARTDGLAQSISGILT
jgi:UDP:flavonoid glycosyltransferase YjiC (YdhE family)